MARIYDEIKAKDFISGLNIELEIYTGNDGEVWQVLPSSKDRKRILHSSEVVIVPKEVWDKIPYAFKYWDAENNRVPMNSVVEEKRENP